MTNPGTIYTWRSLRDPRHVHVNIAFSTDANVWVASFVTAAHGTFEMEAPTFHELLDLLVTKNGEWENAILKQGPPAASGSA